MRKMQLLSILALSVICSCDHSDFPVPETTNENPSSFVEVAKFNVGTAGAAEISAYDPETKRLFVVNNSASLVNPSASNFIDVLDLSNLSAIKKTDSISLAKYGGAVNSLSVSNGKLAAAIQGIVKTDNGKVLVLNTKDFSEVKVINVGALPDMITYSPDGNYILTANEGEPSDNYTIDPEGSISIISVKDNYAVNTINFSAFISKQAELEAKGFRIFGKTGDFLKDIEPEYITVSADSKTAWVTLQENNGIAKINIVSKTITDIFPLGFKSYDVAGNEIDPTDEDKKYSAGLWPAKGVYMPDAIAVTEVSGSPLLFTANEGDAREWGDFIEPVRVRDVKLDPTKFPNAKTLQEKTALGRLNITKFLGDVDKDGDYDELYSFGARSFSVWNGNNGTLVYDSKNELDVKAVEAGVYDDGRSDDKSIEPEGITIGKVGSQSVAFVGLERADAVAVYNISNPLQPKFLNILKSGDAPEGVLFVPAANSPTKKSLLIVSSENDGMVTIYSPSN